jgi:hypothetical protein
MHLFVIIINCYYVYLAQVNIFFSTDHRVSLVWVRDRVVC